MVIPHDAIDKTYTDTAAMTIRKKSAESAATDVPLYSFIALINSPGSQLSVMFANTSVKMTPSSVLITGAGN